MRVLKLGGLGVGLGIAAFAAGGAAACEASAAFFGSAERAEVAGCLAGQEGAAFVDARDGDFATVLHLAAAYGTDPEVIDALREAADPEAWDRLLQSRTKQGLTPLHLATREAAGPATLVRLLGYGADPDAVLDRESRWRGDRGVTALHLAAARPDGAPFISALLAGGADPSWRNASGLPPILVAARIAEDPDGLAAFLAASAVGVESAEEAEDDEGNRPLHVAASNERPLPVIRYLLLEGAEVDTANDAGLTALHLAANFSGDSQVMTLLMDRSAEFCAPDGEGRTPADLLAGNAALKDEVALVRRFHEACREAGE